MMAFITFCHDFIFPLQGRKSLLLLERPEREPEVSYSLLPETHMKAAYLAEGKQLALPVSHICFLVFILPSITTCHKVRYKALTGIADFPPKTKPQKTMLQLGIHNKL